MKKIIYTLDILVVLLIPIAFIFTPVKENETKIIDTTIGLKYLTSKEVNVVEVNENKEDTVEVKEEDITVEKIVPEKKVEEVALKVQEPVSDVLETQVGKMSGYGPDCIGCSGYLASGKYVGDGTIYYNDKTYGNVRMLSGDRTYPMGTIVRVKNSRAGNFIGIVQDRGSSIGFNKRYLFDLLYASEALALNDEVSYNVTFEILRYGY